MPILPKLNLKAAVKLAPITLTEPEVQLSQPSEQSSTSELPITIADDNSVNQSVNCPASQSQSSSNYIVSSRYHSSYGTSNYEVDADEVDDHDDIENNPDDYFHDDDNNDIEHNFKEPQSLKRDYSQFSNNNNNDDDDSFHDIHSTHIDRYSDVANDPDNQISVDGQPPQPISSPPYSLYHGVGSFSASEHPDLITSTSRHSLSDSCSSDQSTNLHPISTITNDNRLLLDSQFAQPISAAVVVAHSKKRRRTVNKLESDPEKLPLCDLLFYNPPETVFQKENKTQNEPITAGDENQPIVASVANRRTSSRANSLTNERSPKSKTPELQQQDSNNNIENELLSEKGPILVDGHCDQENILAKDDESSDTRLVTAGSEKDPIEEEKEVDGDDDDTEEPLALTIDENGEIVLKNPNSLNESGKNGSKKPKPKMKSSTTYNSFRRRERSKNIWNTEETGNFYTALEIVGTDFSLMEAVFFKDRNRDRKQLKQKFKREEKINRAYIDEILYKSLRNRTKLSEYLLKGSSSEANAADIATSNAAAVAAATAANLATTTTAH